MAEVTETPSTEVKEQTAGPESAPKAPPTASVETPAVEAEPDTSATHNHVAIRDFGAPFGHQILRFVKDELIEHRIGKVLRAQGAPIKLVEKSAKEIKGAL